MNPRSKLALKTKYVAIVSAPIAPAMARKSLKCSLPKRPVSMWRTVVVNLARNVDTQLRHSGEGRNPLLARPKFKMDPGFHQDDDGASARPHACYTTSTISPHSVRVRKSDCEVSITEAGLIAWT